MVLSEEQIQGAEALRKTHIHINRLYLRGNNDLAKDAHYNIKAYEMMSDEQVLSSEMRFFELTRFF